jgi:CelD/BcsL family acetyltransferase involved in cellulose biosynthesis
MINHILDAPPYRVTITDRIQISQLKEDWLSIEHQEDLPFFLTWEWIECWLMSYEPRLIVVKAYINDSVVAIGLFTLSYEQRHKYIGSRQLRLNQVGDPLQDQIWMEYNDFITDSDHKSQAVNLCLKALFSLTNWDEIVLSMMSHPRAKEILNTIPGAYCTTSNPCYRVNLAKLKQQDMPYLTCLSANTRHQIKRSMRIYEDQYGPISIQHASDMEQAIDLFHEAGVFHIHRWDDSGYNNHLFIRFHENLIRGTFDKGLVKLIKIKAGSTTIAILYFHIVNKNVYFYLHGLHYDGNSKLKPGMVAHALTTQYFLDRNMRIYDYMGGYSQYKVQLGERSEDLVSVVIQRPRISFALEYVGHWIKNSLPLKIAPSR